MRSGFRNVKALLTPLLSWSGATVMTLAMFNKAARNWLIPGAKNPSSLLSRIFMSAEDFALFRESMQEVLPLKPTNQAQHDTAKPPPIPFKSIEDEQQVIIDMLSDAYDPIEIQPGDMLSYVQPGIQTRIF